MNNISGPPPPPHVKAGSLLRGFVLYQLLNGEVAPERLDAVISKVKQLLDQAHSQGWLAKDQYRLLAVQYACEVLEKGATGDEQNEPLLRDMFDAFVENHQGGPRNTELGGKTVSNKKTSKENFLRAAAVFLWKEDPDRRDRLVSDARKHLGIPGKKALARIVDNHDQRDGDPDKPSPLSVHMPSVKALYEQLGWRSLKDFAC